MKPIRQFLAEWALNLTLKSAAAPCTPDYAEYIVCIKVIHG